MKEIRQGEVYWLDFGPSSGSAPAERHSCLVVQSDTFNRSRIATTVVCLITSNMDRANAPARGTGFRRFGGFCSGRVAVTGGAELPTGGRCPPSPAESRRLQAKALRHALLLNGSRECYKLRWRAGARKINYPHKNDSLLIRRKAAIR